MKKALITTLSALLLFLGLAALVNVSAEKRQNNIEYRLEIITGDSELLNGINITLTAFMNDDYSNSFRLPRDVFYWKSQLRINDGQVSSDDLFAKVEDDFMLPAPDLHIKLLEDLSLTKPVYDFRLAQWPNNIGVEGQSCSVKMNEIFDYYPLSLYCISEDITYGCTYDKYEIYIFVGSSIFIIICIVMIIRNYAFYYKDSKSIYLMKRLPNPAELHVRSLVLPLTAILINIAATGLFMYLYYLYYANLFSINRYFSILEALL